jgi:uncharacterized protein (DUF302 family)
MTARYEMSVRVRGSLPEVRQRVADALRSEGFGILTEIDAQRTLKEKLGAEMDPYLILGACNPQLANRALVADPSLGLMLPCNVVLREIGPEVEVSIMDPVVMFEIASPAAREALSALPAEARGRLRSALDAIAET